LVKDLSNSVKIGVKMAEVTKSVIGKLSGTLGNMVFRNIGDKVIIYTRPHNQKISFSDASVNNRGKFGMSSLLSTNALQLPGIKEAWNSSNHEGRSAYTKIIKFNAKSVEADRLTIKNDIVPVGKRLTVNSFSLTSEKFEIDFNTENFQNITQPYNACLLIFLYDPKNPGTGSNHYFIKDTLIVNDGITTGNKNLRFIMNDTYSAEISLYNKAVIFFALTKTTNQEVYWTNSFKIETLLT
jgi:hypothetical protein